jgi:hypothetical protein
MISTLNGIVFQTTFGERQFSVRTGVLQSNGRAIALSIQDYALAEQRLRYKLLPVVAAPSRYIPSISQKHELFRHPLKEENKLLRLILISEVFILKSCN